MTNPPNEEKKQEEQLYYDCDRCGSAIRAENYLAEYANALLCATCERKRVFDYENPILHPKTNT